jgi:hypothetical protein
MTDSPASRPPVPTTLPDGVTIEPIEAFKDNYIWCIRAGGRAVVVDPGESAPVLAALQAGGLFWARNDPDAQWLEDRSTRRAYLVHWAVYDSQINLPVVYLLEVEDSGRTALPNDDRRWPEARAHLMAQSLGGLKLLTIAQGFDTDFDDLHPKRLRRISLGPMYSHSFTLQSGPISEVLADARAEPGDDWALVWTFEDLRSEREEQAKDGWFGTVQRQIFALDGYAGRGAETGTTRTERMVILPERPFQVLAERNPPGLPGARVPARPSSGARCSSSGLGRRAARFARPGSCGPGAPAARWR